MRQKLTNLIIAIVAVAFLLPSGLVLAQTPSSSNYSVQESSFQSGSDNNASSASYGARGSAGNLGVGIGESGSYQAYGGFITPDEEYVELVVPVQAVDMGVVDPGVPGTGSATFSARAYLNDNYVIISNREPPTNESGDVIDPMTTATTVNTAIEQFGMNLVANTSPVVQGAIPDPQPNGSFAYGEAAPGYNTPDNYQYNAGDTIARSVTRGYGETDYTISYVLNVTTITPAGLYRMEQDLIILATF